MFAVRYHVRASHSAKRVLRQRRLRRVSTIFLGVLLAQVALLGALPPLGLPGPTTARAASVWYVDQQYPTASNSNSCASPSAPCLTIDGALSKAGSGDTININPGLYFECPDIVINLTLVGAGASSTILDADNDCNSVVTVNSGVTVSISGVTMRNGYNFSSGGGGIANQGNLTLDNVTVANNNSVNGGAGIASAAGSTLNVSNSIISGNRDLGSPGGGGGLLLSGATATIRDSTIENNYSGVFGAGLDNAPGSTTTIVNSTIANNTHDVDYPAGSGIYNQATVRVYSSTIAYNSGGGIGISGTGTLTRIANSIVADNPQGDCVTGSGGTITDGGYNIDDGTGCGFSSASGSQSSTDPLLSTSAPADNGGPTPTIALDSGSPAIDAVPGGSCTDSTGGALTADQRGVSRPTSACTAGAFEADTASDTWATALALTQTSGSFQVNQTESQNIYVPAQERWYKFQVTPGSQVQISFTGDPGSVVSLHSDMQASYNALTTPTNAAVASARDAPSGFLPAGFLPAGFLPAGFLPASFLPAGFLPAGFLPAGFLPAGFLPAGFLPSGPVPAGSSPTSVVPSGFQAGPYTGAVWDSLLAISATPNSGVQTITRNTWNNFGYFYVRVAGPADRAAPFTLTVTETGGDCAGVTNIPATPPAAAGIPTGLKTLILWDPSRIAGTSSDIATLRGKLGQFAQRSEVRGAVIDLSQIPGIDGNGSAEQQADANAACPTAKNIVATDIKSVIQAYRAQNPGLQYIVLAGDDHSIPFFRYPDDAGLAPENQYNPPVADTSASQASLRDNFVLGQDEYGASVDVPRGDHSMPIPDLAVGRLVSTASQVSHMLDVYRAANGVLTPHSSLVTGYDFVAGAATDAAAELAAGTNATPTTLIQPQGTPPGSPDPPTWTAADLRQQLVGSRHDIIFMAGHFSAGNLLASDYATQLAASDVASSTADLTNTLVLALGCHGGYNIPGGDAIPGISPSPDWPEAFAEKGATLLATTGYAYGDTVLTAYGALLFDDYVHQLRMGTGPVAVGQAEVDAKKEYLASHPDLVGIDEKTLLETTLYGLPMMGVNMPGQRVSPPTTTSIVASAAPVTTGPGAAVQLAVGQTGSGSSTIDIQPALTRHAVQLTNTVDNSTVATTYLSGRDGTVAHPLEPILPLQLDDVHVPGQILRGVGFWGGTYSDATGITPLTVAPATENSVGHPAFFSTVLYPAQVWTANYFGAISGGDERLVTTPAQYQSATNADGSLATSGTLRRFSDLRFRLYYLPGNWPTNATIAPAAVAAASNIASVSATSAGGQVTFSVRALSSPTAGTQDVWVTYTDPSAPGTWTSLDLTQPNPTTDPTLWQATAALPGDIQFMVQAVNAAGLVSLATNSGAYYTVGASTPQLAPASITLQSPPTSGGYQQTSTFQVHLSADGKGVAGQQVALQVGGQLLFKNTDANGNASFTVPLNQPPGSYTASASFAGSATLAAAQAQPAAFQIKPGPTTLTFTTTSASADYSDPAGIVATLTDAAGHPLTQRSVLFTVACNSQTYQKSVITDYAGRAQLGAVALPAGTYAVSAAYGGQIANGQVVESDPNYQSSSAPGSASLTITPEESLAAYNGDTVIPVNGTLHLSAVVSEADDGYPNDLSRAQVRFVVTGSNGSVVASKTVPVAPTGALTGVAAVAVQGPALAGVYTVSTTVVGGYFTAPPTTTLLAVSNQSGGSTIGVGWFTSQPGWCRLASCTHNGGWSIFTFDVNVRYTGGRTNPTGHSVFKLAGLNFKSTGYQWMIISGNRVQFQGTGTLNGSGAYNFMLTAIGTPAGSRHGTDYIRIKIWNAATNAVIYDSQPNAALTCDPTTPLGGGIIMIFPSR